MRVFDSVHQVLRKITQHTQFTHNTQSIARKWNTCNKITGTAGSSRSQRFAPVV